MRNQPYTAESPPPEEAPVGLSEQSAELWRLARRMWLRHQRTSAGACEACGWMWPCASVQMNDWTLRRLTHTARAAARRRL